MDVIAGGAYLLGVVPLLSIALLELNFWGKSFTENEKLRVHFLILTGFLVVSHVAVIFGMFYLQMPSHEMHHLEHMHH